MSIVITVYTIALKLLELKLAKVGVASNIGALGNIFIKMVRSKI